MVKLHLPYTMMLFFLKNLQLPNWIIFCVHACLKGLPTVLEMQLPPVWGLPVHRFLLFSYPSFIKCVNVPTAWKCRKSVSPAWAAKVLMLAWPESMQGMEFMCCIVLFVQVVWRVWAGHATSGLTCIAVDTMAHFTHVAKGNVGLTWHAKAHSRPSARDAEM